jgi:hypothetical protein
VIKLLVVFSALFSIAAYFPYVKAILESRGTSDPVRPNRASWFVWWLIDITMVASLSVAGSFSAVPMFVAFVIGSSVVLALSVKNGEGGFTRLDLGCVTVALVGIVLWQMLGNPEAAIAASVVAALAGTLPTIRKAWRKPASEDITTWVLFAVGSGLNCIVIPESTFAAAAAPIAVFTAQMSIVVSIIAPRSWRA